MMADDIVSFRIPDGMKRKLDALSAATHRDTAALAQEALEDYLLRQDEQMVAIDEAILSADEGQFVSEDAMSQWLHSWGSQEETPAPAIDVFKTKK